MRLISLLMVVLTAGCAHVQSGRPVETKCTLALRGSDTARAELECGLALSANPDSADAWVNVGLAKLRQGARTEARRHFNEALARNPRHAQALNNLGVMALSDGDLAKAEQKLLAALAVRPDYVSARYNLGVTRFRAGRLDEATKDFKAAIALAPEADSYAQLGAIAFEQNDLAAATASYEMAVKLDASFSEAWKSLGRVHEQRGDNAQARAAYQSCVKAQQDDATCADGVRRLSE